MHVIGVFQEQVLRCSSLNFPFSHDQKAEARKAMGVEKLPTRKVNGPTMKLWKSWPEVCIIVPSGDVV